MRSPFVPILLCIPILTILTLLLVPNADVISTLLMFWLFCGVGFTGLLGFYGHVFMADEIAKYIGWPKGNPFQREIGFANLMMAVLGLLCLWIHGSFWLATVIANFVFMEGAAVGHIIEMRGKKNRAPGNAGFMLYWDIVSPLVLITLLALVYLNVTLTL